MNKGLVVLSLFDGMSCGQISLKELGIEVDKYFASEIEQKAIHLTRKNFPNTIELGDVTKVYYDKKTKTLYKDCERKVIDSLANYPNKTNYSKKQMKFFESRGFEISDNLNREVYKWYTKKAIKVYEGNFDLLIFGSPCQSFSRAFNFTKKVEKKGLNGTSGLFFEALRILKEIHPKYFFFENVKMTKQNEKLLNEYLSNLKIYGKIEGTHINSSIFTYQNRERIYWSNIPNVKVPANSEGLNFQDYRIKTLPRVEKILYHNKFQNDKVPLQLSDEEIDKVFQEEKWIHKNIKIKKTRNTKNELSKAKKIVYLDKSQDGKISLNLSDKEIDEIFNMNKWVYEELKAINPKITKKEVVDEIHKQLEEVIAKSVPFRDKMFNDGNEEGRFVCKNLSLSHNKKCGTISTKNDRSPNEGVISFHNYFRFLTRLELAKAQGVPYKYIYNIEAINIREKKYNTIHSLLGNGWTIDVIKLYFEQLK